MADENKDRENEGRSQNESGPQQQSSQQGTASAAATGKAEDNDDDVRGYGEPTDGSGGEEEPRP